MKLLVHKMRDCQLCNKCIDLLIHWDIAFTSVYDYPVQDRPYPYITIEYEYEEIIDMIAREILK